MYIKLPKRHDIPEVDIFVKILTQNTIVNYCWNRSVMLLIHGGPGGNHTLYSDIENDLLAFTDIVMVDLRGCGYSNNSSVEFCTIDNHIDDLHYILKFLKIDNPIICGCSYGAIVALGYSIKFNHEVDKLILASPAVSGNFIQNAQNNLELLGNPQQKEVAKKLWNGTFENVEDFNEYYTIMSPLYIYNLDKIKPPTASKHIPYNIELVNFAFTTFLREFDFCNDLHLIQANTLIFSGRNDWITDIHEAESLHNRIVNSTLITLDKCGHFPWKDQKDLFLEALDFFLKEHTDLIHNHFTL